MMLRTKTIPCLAAALFISGSPLTAVAQQGGTTLNYEGAEIAAVAKDVALRTGRVLLLDPRLAGRVTIISPPDASLSPDEVWEVFLQTLQVNGFNAVPIGDREYKIIPQQGAIRVPGGTDAQDTAATVTRVVPLSYMDARTAASNLRGLVGDTGFISPIAESNALVIVDSGQNVERIRGLIRQIDVDDSVLRTIQLQNAAAADVANTLIEIIDSGGEMRRPGSLSVVPVDSSNSIVLKGMADEVARLEPLVRQLDSRGVGAAALDTIYLNHADGEQIVPILQEILDKSAGDGGQPGSANSSVAFHKPTNALILNAAPEQRRLIQSIVSRLDIRRPQVQIEAVVVEIANTTAKELGVQYISGGDDIPVTAASFTGTSPNIVSAAGAAYFLGPGSEGRTETVVEVVDGERVETTRQVFDTNDPSNAVAGQLVEAAVSELLSFNGFLAGIAGQTDSGSVYGVLLSAIQSDGSSNVLSVPSVTLLDNETGLLQVGQEIPIVTGEAVGSDFQGGFRTVERRDVGNILEVTPQINEGNTIQLTIRLEVSSISASISENIITNKSTIQTVALAEDGQTLVIGGLIDNDEREQASKVPILGDIPLVGNLFKGQSRNREDSTLMVFIRPTILRDSFSADNITARKYDYVRQEQARRARKGEPLLIDEVMQNYLGPGNYYTPGADGSLYPVQPGGAPVEGRAGGDAEATNE